MNIRFNFNVPNALFAQTCFLVFVLGSSVASGQISKTAQGTLAKAKQEGFTENKGQVLDLNGKPADGVLFKAQSGGLDFYITEKGLTYVFVEIKNEEEDEGDSGPLVQHGEKFMVRYERVDMNLVGANIRLENFLREDPSETSFNFIVSAAVQVYDVRKYQRVICRDIYPGIDWVIYQVGGGGFKYDFVVHPGADRNLIKLVYMSKRKPELDAQGNLFVKAQRSVLREEKPYSYMMPGKEEIKSSFRINSVSKNEGNFESTITMDVIGDIPPDKTLVIDPQLSWSTFYGVASNYEGVTTVEPDSRGNVVMTGYTASTNLPLLSSGNFFQTTPSSSFILKFNAAHALVWATYFGGGTSSQSGISDMAIDANNNIFITGTNSYSTFPSVNSGTYFQASNAGFYDAFIVKFNAAGAILWSTQYGSAGQDQANSLAISSTGNVYVSGSTNSTLFPVQNSGGYFESTLTGTVNNGFLLKFDNAGNRLWATFIKGTNSPCLAADLSGNVILAGSTNSLIPLNNPGGGAYYNGLMSGIADAYVIKFGPSDNLLWGSYFGGSNQDLPYSIVADRLGNVFIAGVSTSPDFPLQNAGTFFQPVLTSTVINKADLFITKFTASGVMQWSTFYGGTRQDFLSSYDNLAVDGCGNLYLAFNTESRNIGTMVSCEAGFNDASMDTSGQINNSDIFIVRFSNMGAVQWATYLGGNGNDFRSPLAVDPAGNLYASGEWSYATNPASYPVVNPGVPAYFVSTGNNNDDVFVARFGTTAINTFSYNGGFCVSDTSHLPALDPGFATGGSFTSAPGLSVNPITGQVLPNASMPGTYTVYYSFPTCYCSQGLPTGSATVSIVNSPTLSVAGNTMLCVGAKGVYTVSGASSYTWAGVTGTATTSTISVIPTSTSAVTFTLTGNNNTTCISKKNYSIAVSKCTGIAETQGPGKWNVYPNPSNREFTVSSQSNLLLLLMNAVGQVLREIELTEANHWQMNISEVSSGVYYLQEKGGSTAYKLVVTEQ